MTEFLLSPEGVSALLGLCLGLLGRVRACHPRDESPFSLWLASYSPFSGDAWAGKGAVIGWF